MLALSPELCGKIIQFTSHRRRDLLSLCLTCKAFQREAEARIYAQLIFADPRRALQACTTVVHNERLALHVRTFCFNQEGTRHPVDLGREFWLVVQRALINMSNLEILILCDNTYMNGWVLDNPAIQFSLQDCKLRFRWEAPVIRFLKRQDGLRSLYLYDPFEDLSETLPQGALPTLQTFDGTFLVGMQMVRSPITHMQVLIDVEPASVLASLPRLAQMKKTLRGLNLVDVMEEISLPALELITRALPDLRHLGLFSYPMTNRHEFHKYLLPMHSLRSIELDVSRWNPPPSVPAGQRALACELQTFCSTIDKVLFWTGTSRFRWIYTTHWMHRVETTQHSAWGMV
ncbi:hypothetical protein NLJ89_g9669 [Agrocybe chaxingu]|uniref:F-box domain-containing protein n=1 Tax=Agrocybe chaxingu TaxID=84603 RepID=A0A9W8MTB8_9AGAR|nr:hypothetical protein NLJ89_g9669 [Agrocybe chaxingu]